MTLSSHCLTNAETLIILASCCAGQVLGHLLWTKTEDWIAMRRFKRQYAAWEQEAAERREEQ